MSNHPYMALFVADFVGDTTHLSDAETGQYLLLLMAMWRHDGELPDDPVKLARIARCRRVSPDVMEFFTKGKGTITQKRLAKELAYAKAFSEKQRANANARWHPKSLENNDGDDATAYATAMPPSPSPSPQTQSQLTGSEPVTVDSEFRDVFWPAYPDKTAKPYALKCFRAARKKASLDTIMGGLKLYIETKPPDRQWCHPSTWLNQERWADQPAPIARKIAVSRTVAELDDFVDEVSNGKSRHGIRSEGGEHAHPQLPDATERSQDLCEPTDGAVYRKAARGS